MMNVNENVVRNQEATELLQDAIFEIVMRRGVF